MNPQGRNGHKGLTITVDDLLAIRLQDYTARGFSTPDALKAALGDVAAQLGLPSISMTEEQFGNLCAEIDRRKAAFTQAKDEGSILVAPDVVATEVSEEEYRAELGRFKGQ